MRLSIKVVATVAAITLMLADVHSARAGFIVSSVTYGAGGTASGTSNGVTFTLSPTFIAEHLSSTGGTYTGFSNPAYHNPPLATSDELHIGGQGFTLTFGKRISSALIYFTDNPSIPDGELDFGIAPTVLSGDVAVSGTRFRPTTINGGLVRLNGISTTTLSHTATGAIGALNFAIVVTPSSAAAVPEPSSAILLVCGGVMCLLWRSRRAVRSAEFAFASADSTVLAHHHAPETSP